MMKADVIIIGAGITGLSTACSLKESRPELDVLILERGILPTGASTKNAGFACIGSLTEKQYDLKLMGEEKLINLISDRYEGLAMLRQRLGDKAIDFKQHGGYELIDSNNSISVDEISNMNDLLKPVFKEPVFAFANEKINEFGFNGVNQLIVNKLEGQLNTGLMMKSLLGYASNLGVRVLTGVQVASIETLPNNILVHIENGMEFTCDQVVICTNAFSKKFLPDEEIMPGRGQVLITKPIENLKFKGVFSFDEGFYYFRNFQNRVLFGGGRNIDFESEATTEFILNNAIMDKLESYLHQVIIPGVNFEIEERWTGIMAFGKEKTPIVKRINPRVLVGARLNGMGVALGSKIGSQLAEMILH